MRYSSLCLLSIALLACHGHSTQELRGMVVRQEVTDTTPSSEPAASTGTENSRPTTGPALGESDAANSTETSEDQRSSTESESSSTRDASASSTDAAASTSAEESTASTAAATTEAPNLSPSQTSDAAASETSGPDDNDELPIQPRITPALGIAGVVLMLTGAGYGLIGVKHRLVQVFLSNAYLAALAVTVVIDYVVKPPISDAVQGAYFVAIFMTGSIFGGGSLIFKEVTEGFGCLLGGFCLAMWLLCLKPGGLITDQTGKGIMIGIFCAVVWGLSWSQWTRNYGLIGSTAFAGATALILGIDCFSRAGLKEFWLYIWQLNDNLFPLGTDTYAMTRGMIVELIAIILLTIIGVLSQIKLWKIVRDRRNRREAAKQDDVRRQDVVEEAIGRHLERQNDRDRATWEKQYGNGLTAKRATVLWSEAHPEKSVTHIVPFEDKRLSSVESLEMSSVGPPRSHRSHYGSKAKRASNVTVNAIPEEQENLEGRTSMERKKALVALDPDAPATSEASETATPTVEEAQSPFEEADKGPEVVPLPFKIPASDSQVSLGSVDSARSPHLQPTDDRRTSKRRSLRSLLSRSPRLSTSSEHLRASESQDRLAPSVSMESLSLPPRSPSRASSLAATLDEDNDVVDLKRASRMIDMDCMPETPTILVSPVEESLGLKTSQNGWALLPETPPSPTEVSMEVEEDPEELSRPVAQPPAKSAQRGSTMSGSSERHGSNSSGPQQTTGPSSLSDGLTKGALEQVPSQVSNVVMSYRTNEWAKHIADADAPIFAEPEQIAAEDGDAPVQLAPPAAASPTDTSRAAERPRPAPVRTLSASSTPPPPHVASPTVGDIVAHVQEPQRVAAPSRSESAPLAVTNNNTNVPILSPPPPAAARPSLKGKRSSTLNRSSAAIKPIQENEVTDFARAQSRQSSAPTPPQQQQRIMMMSPTRPNSAATHRMSSTPSLSQRQQQQPPYTVHRNASYSSLQHHPSAQLDRLSRSSSFMSGIHHLPQSRSETRLETYESRQPAKRDLDGEQQRRETLLTEWRMGQQLHGSYHHLGGGAGAGAGAGGAPGLISQIPASKEAVEVRRAQMLLDREHDRLVQDHERAKHLQRQMAMDQVMRQPVMQDAHREAMRRMQASVNK